MPVVVEHLGPFARITTYRLPQEQFEAVVDLLRSGALTVAAYVPDGKEWYALNDFTLDLFLERLKALGVNVKRRTAETQGVRVPDTVVSRDGCRLWPFQVEGVRHLLTVKRGLLGDEMGLGKTCQAAVAVGIAEAYPCLVVCPAFLADKWRDEVERWTQARVRVASGGRDLERAVAGVAAGEYDVLVVSYGLLSRTGTDAVLTRCRWRSVIADEAHMCKNWKAARTAALVNVVEQTDPEYVFLLTGTPLVRDDPTEVYSLFTLLYPDIGRNPLLARKFRSVMCIFDELRVGKRVVRVIKGITYPERLGEALGHVMLRRLARDVARQLPPIITNVVTVQVEMSPELAEIEKKLMESFDLLFDTGRAPRDLLGQLVKYRQAVGTEKAKKLANSEWLYALVEETSKVVLFFEHKDALNAVLTQMKRRKIPVYVVTGDVLPSRRTEVLARARAEGRCVLLCTTSAVGVGVDLDFIRHGVFVELPYSPTVLVQAEKRLHRLTTEEPPVLTYLVAIRGNGSSVKSLEWLVLKRLREKKAAFTSVVGQMASGGLFSSGAL